MSMFLFLFLLNKKYMCVCVNTRVFDIILNLKIINDFHMLWSGFGLDLIKFDNIILYPLSLSSKITIKKIYTSKSCHIDIYQIYIKLSSLV